jgi:hypothetical protein
MKMVLKLPKRFLTKAGRLNQSNMSFYKIKIIIAFLLILIIYFALPLLGIPPKK